MSSTHNKDYIKWAKERFRATHRSLPSQITDSKFNRQQDYNYYKKLKSLTREFIKTYDYHTITNERREKKRFFRSLYQNKTYNPDFHYKKKPSLSLAQSKSAILALDKFSKTLPCDTALGQIYRRRIFSAQKAIVLATLSQKEGFSWASKQYYNFKKPKKINLPKHFALPHNDQEYIEAYEIIYLAQTILSQIGLKHKARLSSPRYRFRGMATTRRSVKIGVGTLRSPAHIIRSLAHEVLGHALCSTNALKYPAFFARKNSISTLLKEEGIAVKMSKLAYQNLKHLLPRSLRSNKEDYIPLLRIKAINKAQKKSFNNTFLALTRFNINNELAWGLTVRAKRGLRDTSLPGANFHDSLYYFGLKEIENLVSQKKSRQAQISFLNKLAQGKFDLLEFPYLQKNFPDHQNLDLGEAFVIFTKEFKKIIKEKLIK